jgi:hypothetical protein
MEAIHRREHHHPGETLVKMNSIPQPMRPTAAIIMSAITAMLTWMNVLTRLAMKA